MRRHFRKLAALHAAAFVALLGSLLAVPLSAQSGEIAAVRVRVIDAATGQPIEGAQVGFPELRLFRLANKAGYAQILEVPPGTRTLEVTMLGYGKASRTLLLEGYAVATGEIALTTDPIEIEGLTVTTSAQIKYLRDMGFYNRQKLGFGHQFGALDLASIVATQPGDYFQTIPTVEVHTGPFGRKEVTSRRSCVSLSSFGLSAETPTFGANAGGKKTQPFVSATSPNVMAIYVDGVRYRDDFSRIPITSIEAMEVYVGSQVPMQFAQGAGGACGVILIWSKW